MNLWLKPDWDRGYEKGREAGIKEAATQIDEVLTYLEHHLGPDIATNTSLNNKEAYQFGIDYVALLRLKFKGEQK